MTSTAEPAAQRSNWAPLLLAATGSGLLGLALGWRLAQQQAKQQRRSKPRLVYGAKLGPAATPRSGSPGSVDSTPCATPRCLSREDSAHGAGLCMVLLVRTDAALVGGATGSQRRGRALRAEHEHHFDPPPMHACSLC